MLIPVSELNYVFNVHPTSIVHVGAHNAEELEDYLKHDWGRVIWVEAQPEKCRALSSRIPSSHKLINAAVWDVSGVELNLNIMTNTESTSLLQLGTHTEEHPEVTFSHAIPVETLTLSDLLLDEVTPDLLTLDIQGVELRAIKGFGERISEVKWIYTEVNKKELYKDCALIGEINTYLAQFGFRRVVTRWTIHNWGDALYANSNLVKPLPLSNRALRVFSLLKSEKLKWKSLIKLKLKRLIKKL